MEIIRAIYRPDFKIDLRTTWIVVHAGVVVIDSHKRMKYWKHWCRYVACCGASPYFDREGDGKLVIITEYTSLVRVEKYEHGRKFCVQNALDALGAISKKI